MNFSSLHFVFLGFSVQGCRVFAEARFRKRAHRSGHPFPSLSLLPKCRGQVLSGRTVTVEPMASEVFRELGLNAIGSP